MIFLADGKKCRRATVVKPGLFVEIAVCYLQLVVLGSLIEMSC